ncbi:hypothetical protein JCM11641_006654 [Rhodosporidiobolus odoratus]
MGAIRLPGTLITLGADAYTLPRLRRRITRSLAVLLPFAFLAAFLAVHGHTASTGVVEIEQATTRRPAHTPVAQAEAVDAQQQPQTVNGAMSQQPRAQWSKEDRQLRKYQWVAPEAHGSLNRRVEELSPDQQRVRDWLLRSRVESTGGTGIGLGATDPPQPIRPAVAGQKHAGQATEDEGPGLFVDGSYDKYSDLVREWQTGRPPTVCEKGDWEDTFAELQANMLRGKREPRLLEFMCRDGEYCGGFADRILGMVSTFLYSILTNRAFSMTWEQPAPLDLLFDSPFIDWSRPFRNSTTPVGLLYSNTTLLEQSEEINAHNWEEKKIDDFFPRFVAEYGSKDSTPWLQLDFNRGVVIRSFSYPPIKPHLDRLGLKLESAYSCLLNYLLRPKPAVLAFIAQYTSMFALPEYFVVGLQVRTGDNAMWASRKDAINTVSYHSQYFRCAAQVAATYAAPSQKVLYYLITDSHALEQDALAMYPDQVVVTGLKQAHIEIKTDHSEGMKAVKRAADGFMRTVAESWIFAATDFQILTYRSGFGKIPTWLRGRPNTTIQLFNPHTDPEYTKMVKKKHKGKLPKEVDCSSPEALKSFSEMAQDWSLG